MRKILILLLILCLTLSGIGCSREQQSHMVFYYLRSSDTIQYGQSDALMEPVEQDFTSQDLDSLLQQYLNGPTDEMHRNPFPKGTYLLSTILREDMMIVVLSREFSTLDGIQLTLAGACLTATCRNLTGLDRIQVRSGENIYDFDYNSYVFLDDCAGK